jgi:hypothetical protein
MRDGARKRPVRHIVSSHVRNRKHVRPYTRGSGTATPKPEPKVIKEHTPRVMSYGGWKGSKYEKTRHLPIKEIAKLVKAEIHDKYPKIKVSVATKSFSGGREVNVHIKSYPNHFLIKKVIYPEMEGLPDEKIPSYAWGWKYTADAQSVVDGIKKILNSYNFDDSDLQTDYFSNSFYGDVEFDWDIRKAEEKRIGLIH